MNVDDGIEDIRWIRGLGEERSPAASYALLPNPKKWCSVCSRRGIEIFVVCFLLTRGQMFSYQTPDRRPPRITGRVVNTVTRRWVGTPNERTPFIFMPQSLVLSIDVCQDSESRRFELNIWLSFSQADLRPTSGQEIFLRTFFQVWNVFFKICAHIASGR